MESESLANGGNVEENLLKSSKSTSDETTSIHNGNHENGNSELIENGHDVEVEIEVHTIMEKDKKVKKESTPSKRELKESTPSKRELRSRELKSTQNTERSSKSVTPKRESKPITTPVTPATNEEILNESGNVEGLDSTADDTQKTTEESSDTIAVKSEENEEKSNLSEDTVSEPTQKKSQESAVIDIPAEDQKQPIKVGFFSSFLSPRKTIDTEKIGEVASPPPSVAESDSTSMAEAYGGNSDIQSRRGIKAFSRFPGRNVSLSPARKRKGDGDDVSQPQEKKRLCRDSGSEKSPGWRFLSSPFGKIWSPSRKFDVTVPTSTPLKKTSDDDSMAVNFNELSKQSLESSTQIITENAVKPKEERSRCLIM